MHMREYNYQFDYLCKLFADSLHIQPHYTIVAHNYVFFTQAERKLRIRSRSPRKYPCAYVPSDRYFMLPPVHGAEPAALWAV